MGSSILNNVGAHRWARSIRGPALRKGLAQLSLVALVSLLGPSLGCVSAEAVRARDQNLKIASAKRDLGVDSLVNGRTPMAIRQLQHALELNPEDPVTIHWLGEAYRRRGLLDKALEKLLQSLELDPEAQELRMNLAGLYILMKRFPEAIEQSQILIDDPTFATPWRPLTNRGWAELQAGNFQASRVSFVTALEFRPRYWPARLNLGILETKQGNRLEAILNFERVLERDVGENAEAEVNYRLGSVYVSLGRLKKAVSRFRLAAKVSPEGSWGKRSEENLRLLY